MNHNEFQHFFGGKFIFLDLQREKNSTYLVVLSLVLSSLPISLSIPLSLSLSRFLPVMFMYPCMFACVLSLVCILFLIFFFAHVVQTIKVEQQLRLHEYPLLIQFFSNHSATRDSF